jgi:DNA-binding beta-propeller fold protein YncE
VFYRCWLGLVKGVFVINEGNFLQNNGSMSFFTREQNTADNDIFLTTNGSDLKGGVAGFATQGDISIVLVDNSAAGLDKVEIVNSNTFEKIATVGAPDIENPRDVVIVSATKAFVSCWGTTGTYPNFFINPGYIAVIDLTTNKVTAKIPAPKGVENMTFSNGKLFAGTIDYSGSNTLTVVNTTTNEVLKEVGFNVSPNPFGADANGKIWINAGLQVIRICG